MKRKLIYMTALLSFCFLLGSCDEEAVLIGDSVTALSNDCIKRSLAIAPNIVGEEIEFAYAMALPEEMGKLTSAQVVATIAGATGTYFDPNSYYTNASGQDVPVLVASESQTDGTKTSISFTADTCAATLRFYYIIPEEARDKEVSFTFSVKASNGQSAEYKMGPYKISRMDMKKNISLVSGDKCYLSFQNDNEAVTVYSAVDLAADPSLASKVDVVYAYNSNADLSHAFYTVDAPEAYRPGVIFPSGFANQTKMIKEYGLRDRQLSNLQYSHFIDDLDFKELSMDGAVNYILILKEESGAWIETKDAKYRAFAYVNKATASGMTISVKRYKM
ncbi:MAG: DUF4466 family protein [Prevotella sp.]|jgi:hypothetical protein